MKLVITAMVVGVLVAANLVLPAPMIGVGRLVLKMDEME